jgi:DNA repair photolyase
VLTKGTLLRRDLPQLAKVNETTPVSVAMSIAVFDEHLQHLLEPGTPSTAARLATVRHVRAAGLDCAVFLAPVLPALTDATAQLDDALGRLKAAGATSVLYTSLRLGPDVREWFLAWLAREHPCLVARYEQLNASGSRAPESYRRLLQARMTVLLRRHGLRDGAELAADESAGGTARRFSLSPRGLREAAGAPVAQPPSTQPPSTQPAGLPSRAPVASSARPTEARSVGEQPQLF